MKYSYHFFVSYFVLILKATALTNQPTFSSTTSNSKSLFTSQYYSMLGYLISVFFTPTFSWRFINTKPSTHFLESVALATVLEIVFNYISTCLDSDQSWSLVLVLVQLNETKDRRIPRIMLHYTKCWQSDLFIESNISNST